MPISSILTRSGFEGSPASATRRFLPLVAVLVLAAILRCDRLPDVSYTFDEAFCWKMTTFPFADVATRAALDNHPPLYFIVLWAWVRMFGDSAEALRLLSVLFGLATVTAAYLLVRQIVNDDGGEQPADGVALHVPEALERPETSSELSAGALAIARLDHSRNRLSPSVSFPALGAAALMALSPLQINWSQQVRMYALGAALAVTSTWLLVRALQRNQPQRRDFLWYGLAAVALAYTHYFGLFVLGGQFLYAVGWTIGHLPTSALAWSERFRIATPAGPEDQKKANGSFQSPSGNDDVNGRISGRRKFAYIVATFGFIALVWLPWLPVFLRHKAQVSTLFWSRELTTDHVLRTSLDLLGVFSPDALKNPIFAWGAIVAELGLPAAMLAWGRFGLKLVGAIVLLTFIGAVELSVFDRNIISTRYFAFAQALLVCGAAALAAQIPYSFLRVSALTLLVVGSSWTFLRYSHDRGAMALRPGMRAAASYLADIQQRNEPIIVGNPMVQITAAGHWFGNEPIRVLAHSQAFPYFQGTAVMRASEYLTPKALDALPCQRVWAIDTLNCLAGSWTTKLSSDWIDVSEEVFPEQPSVKSQIVVRCYERRRRAIR